MRVEQEKREEGEKERDGAGGKEIRSTLKERGRERERERINKR